MIRPQFLPRGPNASDLLLIGYTIVSLLSLFYFLYHYAWIRDRQFTGPMGSILYYGIPLGLACLLLASLKLKPVYRLGLALLCVATTTGLYGAELWFHFANNNLSTYPDGAIYGSLSGAPTKSKEKVAALARQFGISFDTRDDVEVIVDLRRRGKEAVPFVGPPFLENNPDGTVQPIFTINGNPLVPIGAIANKLLVLCNETGEYVTYESDEHGFNNPKGLWRVNDVDVAGLGESYAQGFCVPPESNFISLIRQRYPKTLNLAFSSEGPLFQLAMIKEYLSFLAPKVILWSYSEGIDLDQLLFEGKSKFLMRYLTMDFNQSLFARQSYIDQVLSAYTKHQTAKKFSRLLHNLNANDGLDTSELIEIAKLSAIRQRLQLIHGVQTVVPGWLEVSNINLFKRILESANSRVGAWGGKIYFIYLPSWDRYAKDKAIPERERDSVLNTVRDLGIPVIDLTPAFGAQNDPLSLFPFRRFGHYTETANQLIAREIVNSLPSARPERIVAAAGH